MKRKLMALLAAILMLQLPIQASDTDAEETEAPAESVIDEKTSVFIDYLCLMSMYAHPPKLEVFAEKTKEAYYCAKMGDYKKASELFETYLTEFSEIVEFHESDFENNNRNVSENASLISEVYDFYCKVGFKYCAMSLNSLSCYINCSQSPEGDGCYEIHEKEYLEYVETTQYVMDLIDYACRYVTLSYTKGLLGKSDDSEVPYNIICETFTTPYEEGAYDWYTESYLALRDDFETEFDIKDIPKAVDYTTLKSDEESNDTAEQTTADDDSSSSIVYWVADGKVYHLTNSCYTLRKSTDIKTGTIDQSGKPAKCKVCG